VQTASLLLQLYALDTMLDLKPGATKKDLLKAMEGHVLAEGQLMGDLSKEIKHANIQHRTPNIHMKRHERRQHWMFDVGC